MKVHRLLGECGPSYNRSNEQQVLAALNLGLCYLKHFFAPVPEGIFLETIWAEYDGWKWPVIALGFEQAEADAITSKVGFEEMENTLADALRTFSQSVDWIRITAVSQLPD